MNKIMVLKGLNKKIIVSKDLNKKKMTKNSQLLK